MNISDNILKHHLRNAYFLAGTACGGKTTMTKRLAEKHGCPLHIDGMESHNEHKKYISPEFQPAMSQTFSSWTEYFNRPYEEYAQWSKDCLREDIELILMDLVARHSGERVFVDVHVPLDIAKRLFDHNQIVYLVAEPHMVIRDYFKRPDHKEILDCIMGLPNPEQSRRNTEKALAHFVEQFLHELYQTDWYYIERDENSTIENTLHLIETHFGLTQRKPIS